MNMRGFCISTFAHATINNEWTILFLFVKSRDDMEMCELSFDATQLTRKKGAEIIAIEFETVWHQCGGSVYHVRLNMK
ncbi:hypothetical protein QQG55_24385 [Brugia pahangi]